MHGFCDASQRAFRAYIYFRTSSQQPSLRVTMFKVLRRVASLRTVSLPRLELSAALLLVRLINKVKESFEIKNRSHNDRLIFDRT